MLVKSKVLETVEEFPNNFSLDELFAKLYIIDKIEKGLEQGKNGESVSEDELDKIIDGWFE